MKQNLEDMVSILLISRSGYWRKGIEAAFQSLESVTLLSVDNQEDIARITQENPPDLLVLDTVSMGQEYYPLCIRIQETNRHSQCVVLTDMPQKVEDECKKSGVTVVEIHYAAQLVKTFQEIIRKRKQQPPP